MRINPESLRTIRTDREVSLVELAPLVGCTASHLTNVEAGRREASVGLIKALAKALHVPLLALLGPDDREGLIVATALPDDDTFDSPEAVSE